MSLYLQKVNYVITRDKYCTLSDLVCITTFSRVCLYTRKRTDCENQMEICNKFNSARNLKLRRFVFQQPQIKLQHEQQREQQQQPARERSYLYRMTHALVLLSRFTHAEHREHRPILGFSRFLFSPTPRLSLSSTVISSMYTYTYIDIDTYAARERARERHAL